jgi:polyhydroxybutyrate depolymerase
MLRAALAIVALAACSSQMSPTVTGGDSPPDAAAVAPATACTGLASAPLDDVWTVMGRQVTVHVPTAYVPTAAMPLVLDLHGLASSGADQATLSHMHAKADAAGFIALSPDGTGSPLGWNAGDCCAPATTSGVDDNAFIGALLDEAESRLCVDPHRIYAAGFSNGAYLAHQLGCHLADRIAAIGTVSGVLSHETCAPSRPVPVIHVHGELDFVVPYGGGGFNGSMSVDASIAAWMQYDACDASASPTTFFDHGDATCVNHGSCAGGADVALCTISDGGHQWPGGDSVGALNGVDSSDLSATDQLWTFFAAHPMP